MFTSADKAIVSAIAGAAVTILAYILSLLHLAIPAEVATAFNTILATVMVYYFPNKGGTS
jgi:hypothetical protein